MGVIVAEHHEIIQQQVMTLTVDFRENSAPIFPGPKEENNNYLLSGTSAQSDFTFEALNCSSTQIVSISSRPFSPDANETVEGGGGGGFRWGEMLLSCSAAASQLLRLLLLLLQLLLCRPVLSS